MTTPNGWTIYYLNENYRCDSTIVTAANALISHNRNRIHKTLVSGTGTTGTVLVHEYGSATEELVVVAKSINQRLSNLSEPPAQIAVLLRTNKLVGDFKRVLLDAGVPVRSKAAVILPADWQAARAFITLLTNPENNATAYKFLSLKLGPEQAEQMLVKANSEYQSLNATFMKIKDVQVADVTAAMLDARFSRESIGRVREAVEQLPAGATVLELQYAMTQRDANEQEEGDGVTVTTLHSAKGREWDVVYLPAWEEGILPGRGDVEEERRLAFVGITRARHTVNISWAAQRTIEWKGVQKQTRSRFIGEVLQ